MENAMYLAVAMISACIFSKQVINETDRRAALSTPDGQNH